MAKVVLADTNFSSSPIRDALENWGFEVFVLGNKPTDTLARSNPQYIQLDYSDPHQLKKVFRDLGAKYLVPGCNDQSYISCAQVASELGLKGFDTVPNTNKLNNKREFKRIAETLHIPVARVIDPTEIKSKGRLIVKPVDSFSGRGVSVVNSDSAKQLSSAILNAKKASRTGEIIVEEFVQGQLYSVSAFVVDRKVVREFFVAEFCTVNPFVVDLSYLATDLPNEIVENIRLHLERMSNALDLADGLFHVQFIYDGQNFSFIETTRRCPGDLYSQLIELATGFEYSKAYAAAFVDLRHEQSNIKQELILRHTVSRSYHVRLDSLTIKEPVNLRRLIPLSLVGDQLAPSPTSRVAILFMSTTTENSLTELATKIRNNELLDLN